MIETADNPATAPAPRIAISLAMAIIIASLGWYLANAFVGFDNTLLGLHAFRQTQTALYTQSILDGDGVIGYELPVFGPPWRVPFEFPVYEAIVASVVRGTGIDLVHAGRLVSIFSLVIAALGGYVLLRQLRTPKLHAAIITALILMCPMLQFWSRAFMIETTALMLSVLWLSITLFAVQRESLWTLAVAIAVGSLASGAKATTFLIFLALLTLIVIAWLLKRTRPRDWPGDSLRVAVSRQLPMLGLATGIPFVSAYAWTKVTDVLKADNPFSKGLTSGGLSRWNFGTLDQRFKAATWDGFWKHIDGNVLGQFAIATIALFVLAMIFTTATCRRRAAIAVIAFLIPMLVFTNLFFVHDYYFTSSAAFAMAALGFAGAGLLQRSRPFRIAGVVYFAVVFALLQWGFFSSYRKLQKWNPQDEALVGAFIAEHTDPNDLIIVYGYTWNPSIPFYADRKAIMMSQDREPDNPAVQRVIASTHGMEVGAVVFCRSMVDNQARIESVRDFYGFEELTFAIPEKIPKFRVFLVD